MNNGISYQPKLVIAGFFSSTVSYGLKDFRKMSHFDSEFSQKKKWWFKKPINFLNQALSYHFFSRIGWLTKKNKHHSNSWNSSQSIVTSPVQDPLKKLKKTDHRHMDVSENRGTPKSSILIRFSIINRPFLRYQVPLFLETLIWTSREVFLPTV